MKGPLGTIGNRASHEGTNRGQIDKNLNFSDFRFGSRDPFKTLPCVSGSQEQFFLARIVNYLAVSCKNQKILDFGFLDSAESGQSAQGGQAGECGECGQAGERGQGGQAGECGQGEWCVEERPVVCMEERHVVCVEERHVVCMEQRHVVLSLIHI